MRFRGKGAGEPAPGAGTTRRRILAAACTAGLSAMAGCHEEGLLNFGGHEREETGDLETALDNPTGLYPPYSGVESVVESVPTLAAYSPMVFPGMDSELFVVFEDVSLVTENAEESPIVVGQYIHVDDVVVLAGQIDRAALAGQSTVEERDSYEDFTIFRVRGAYGGHWPVAANDSHLLFGLGETFEDDRQLVESAIDTAAAGVTVGEDRQWLRERCSTGAFVVGANWDEKLFLGDGQDKGFLVDVGVDRETILDVLEFFSTTGVEHSQFVADGHEDGRVTRTGLAVAEGGDTPAEETLLEQLSPEAETTNRHDEGNRLVLEAFWQ